MELASWSDAEAQARQWHQDYGRNWSTRESVARRYDQFDQGVYGQGSDRGGSQREGEGGSTSSTRTHGGHQTLVPQYEQFYELMNRTYYSFDEQRNLWRKPYAIRQRASVICVWLTIPTCTKSR